MKSVLLEKLAADLAPVFKKYGVLRAIVFGSLARGDQSRRSDLDLIVVQETDKRFLDRYEGILREITESVRCRDVDLLIYTPGELERIAGRRFIDTALKEGIVLYEREEEKISG